MDVVLHVLGLEVVFIAHNFLQSHVSDCLQVSVVDLTDDKYGDVT